MSETEHHHFSSVWCIAEQLLCNKTFQSRDIINQDLFVPRRHLSMCTGELEPSQNFGRSSKPGDVSLGRGHCSRGAGDQILKSPWKWRGCFHYYLEGSRDDNHFLCSLHGREQTFITNLSLAHKQRPVWSERTLFFPGLPVGTVWAVTHLFRLKPLHIPAAEPLLCLVAPPAILG